MEQLKYLIAIPAMDNMPTATVASLVSMKRVGASRFSFLCNSLVYDARNMLVQEAIDTGAGRLLFLDSDMFFAPDLMERLAARMDEGLDFVCGLYFRRKIPTAPCIYREVSIIDDVVKTQVYTDYPKNSLFKIAGCGMGAVMMSVKMLKHVQEETDKPFLPYSGALGEDLSFCHRAHNILGYDLWCDSSIKVGHVGTMIYTEDYYQP